MKRETQLNNNNYVYSNMTSIKNKTKKENQNADKNI